MSKLRAAQIMSALGAVFACAPLQAQACGSDGGPAILVAVEGLKSRTGNVRIQAFSGDPHHWFDKGTYVRRMEVPAQQADQMCLPLPKPGIYAISVRHDLNANGKSDRSDGGGMSGNPEISLFDLLFKRKPSPARVQVRVGSGVTQIQVVMNYIQGGTFGPIPKEAR